MVLKILTIIQVIAASLMTVAILMQARGSGLSGVFGGDSQVFRTKRGIEKSLYIFTIIIAIIFFGVSLLKVII